MVFEALLNPLAAWLGPSAAALLLLAIALFTQWRKSSQEHHSTFYQQQRDFYTGLSNQNKEITKELTETRERLDALYDSFHGMARYAHHIRAYAHDLMQVFYSAGKLGKETPKRQLPPVPSLDEASSWQAPKLPEKENPNG